MAKDVLIIGICGGSGSGKTTIIQELMHLLEAHSPALLSLDNYYRDISEQRKDEQGHVNFDLPTAIDSELFTSDLKKLISGESIRIKKYAFNLQGDEQFLDIPSTKIILTEGIFLFNIPEVMSLLDLKIYVELDGGLQLQRRLQRDVKERGYDQEAVLYQWNNHVLPAFKNYIEIHKKDANVIIYNDGDFGHLINQVDRYILNNPRINEFCFSLTQ